ncbi:MAG TPA: MFS transporter [Bacillota bacterium]|nr:MFS transporter [Bacillota bacterium]
MRQMLLKTFYFLFSLSVGAFQFLNLYYIDVGLTVSQVGVLFAVGPLVMIIAQPLWGMLTDYWNAPRMTLLVMTLGTAATALFFPFSYEFTSLLLLNVIYFFFQSSVQPIADGTALAMLKDRKDFGKIRLWGSFGYAVGVLIVGEVLDVLGLHVMFILHSCFLVMALIFALKLPVKMAAKRRFRVREAVGLFKNPAFVLFLLFSFLVHLTVHSNNAYYGIHLENLGASVSLIGVALMIKSILEVPFFAMSGILMRRFSYRILLSSVAVIYACRWLVLGYSHALQVLVWSQIFLSLSFSIQYFASAAYVDDITPPRYRATGQTFYWAVSFGLGGLVGNSLAGWLLKVVDIHVMYQISTIVSLVAILFLWIRPKQIGYDR